MPTVQIIAWGLGALAVAAVVGAVLYREWRVRRLPGKGYELRPSPEPASRRPEANASSQAPPPAPPAAEAPPAPEPEALRHPEKTPEPAADPEPEPAPESTPEPAPPMPTPKPRRAKPSAPLAELESKPEPAPGPVVGEPLALRPPPSPFVGRETVRKELLHGLRTGEQRAATIHPAAGASGVGATSLALAVANDVLGEYPGRRLQLDLGWSAGGGGAELGVAEAMRRIVTAVAPEASSGLEDGSIEETYRRTLAAGGGVLVVLNASGASQVRSLLPPRGWACVATSAERFTLPGVAARRVDPMTESDAVMLAESLAPGRVDVGDADAARLAGLVGRLPLAIELASRPLAAREDLAIAEHLSAVEEAVSSAGEPVAGAVSASLGTLEEDARQRFAELSLFGGPIDASAAASVWDLSNGAGTERAAALLGRLHALGLLMWDSVSRRYAMHPAVRRCGRWELGEPEKLVALRYVIHATRSLARIAELAEADPPAARRLAELEEPNVRSAASLLADRPSDPDLDLLRDRFERARASLPHAGGVASVASGV